jgi:hypothetical protein
MDEENKATLLAQEARLSSLEKRFDDLKWYFGGVAALVTAGIAVYSILIGMNFSSEKTALQTFKSEVREELGKTDKPPDLELLDASGHALGGAIVPAKLGVDEQKHVQLFFSNRIRNVGGGSSGPISMKLYVRDPLKYYNASDERDFTSEDYIPPKEIEPNEIPGGGYNGIYHHSRGIATGVPEGKYPMMLKVYYGKGKVASAQFTLDIANTLAPGTFQSQPPPDTP